MVTRAELASNPTRRGTLKYACLEATIGARTAIHNLFRDIEVAGGTVSFQNEYRSFWKTTFTRVRIEGPASLLLAVDDYIKKLG